MNNFKRNVIVNNSKCILYGLVTDSPNVMIKTRNLSTGSDEGGIKFVNYAYGCACHALSLCIKDLLKINRYSKTFKEATKVAYYFRGTHLGGKQLDLEREKISPKPQTVKTFPKTRWNGASVMINSLIDNKETITTLFTKEFLKDSEESLLDIHETNGKAREAYDICMRGKFWSELKMLKPILSLFANILTFLES